MFLLKIEKVLSIKSKELTLGKSHEQNKMIIIFKIPIRSLIEHGYVKNTEVPCIT